MYAAREDGVIFVAQITNKFEVVAENSMGEQVIASPVPVENALLIRGEHHLFCIGGRWLYLPRVRKIIPPPLLTRYYVFAGFAPFGGLAVKIAGGRWKMARNAMHHLGSMVMRNGVVVCIFSQSTASVPSKVWR